MTGPYDLEQWLAEHPLPRDEQALAFERTKRPYDPAGAIEFIHAFFRNCPDEHKPQLLAAIEMLVRDVEPMWGAKTKE